MEMTTVVNEGFSARCNMWTFWKQIENREKWKLGFQLLDSWPGALLQSPMEHKPLDSHYYLAASSEPAIVGLARQKKQNNLWEKKETWKLISARYLQKSKSQIKVCYPSAQPS